MSLDPKYAAIETTKSSELTIDGQGAVRSQRFSDIYFNPSEGYEESKYVYIEGNRLPERWKQLFASENGRAAFTIAETGFGTGLNFLTAAEEWEKQTASLPQSEKPNKTLYYYGIDKHPLTRIALKKLLSHYNPVPHLASKLLSLYPDVKGGSYFLDFATLGLSIKLILLFGEASDQIERLENYSLVSQSVPQGKIDAWFLDGFSPSENSQMWSEHIFSGIASNSKSGSTVASFSVAAPVKSGLSQNGFLLAKKSGFRKKREMLTAVFNEQYARSCDTRTTERLDSKMRSKHSGIANVRRCYSRSLKSSAKTKRVAIVGAGIAGSTLANNLASKGARVTVYDGANKIAHRASGNNVAVLHAKTFKERSLLADFTEAALHHARHFYDNHSSAEAGLGQQLWQPSLDKKHVLAAEMADGEFEFRSWINNPVSSKGSAQGICFEGITALKPDLLCHALLGTEGIDLALNTNVARVEKSVDGSSCRLTLSDGQTRDFDAIVIAAGSTSGDLLPNSALPLRTVRGQTTSLYLPGDTLGPEVTLRHLASTTICGQGYLVTEQVDATTVALHYGATYKPNSSERRNSATDTLSNLDNIADLLASSPIAYADFLRLVPTLRANILTNHNIDNVEQITVETAGGTVRLENRSEIRAATPDYLPVAGPLADSTTFIEDYHSLADNARQEIERYAKYQEGIFILSGLGSNGFSTAPLLSELLASDILNLPYPVAEDIRQALSPQRFLIRDIIRGRC